MKRHHPTFICLILAFAFMFLVNACNGSTATAVATQGTDQETATPFQPTIAFTATATMEPMAVLVNGEGILLADFQEDLLRFQNATSNQHQEVSAEDANQRVLSDLIGQTLLAQAAVQGGYLVDETTLQARIDELAQKLGGNDVLAAWETQNGYSDASFRRFLKLSLESAWERDQIITSVPSTADEVHARQILVKDADLANQIYQQLQAGDDFEALAFQYDPLTGGDLGWFPRGYLFKPEVEAAAFELQAGQYSSVIQTDYGYHMIYVIERDPQHPLSPEARLELEQQALDQWISDQRSSGDIQVSIP
jgi:peptidyl-prolyl cis-trans isomerase C